MIRAYIIIVIIFLCGSMVLANEQLCPAPKASDPKEDFLKIKETEFNIDKALQSLNFLDKKVYEIIKDNDERTYQLIRSNKIDKEMPLELLSVLSNERFYLGYPNHLSIVKGTLLKYRLLYLRELISKSTQTSSGIKNELEKAKKDYCDFISSVQYVD